ncbi:hypothetical protein MMC34_002059 [Xylographa carneopallida]|nr:hypothetical protein [Xylographa carneopallida]
MFLDDMSAYEAEGSLDGAVSLRESNTSIRMDMLHLSQYRKHWDNIPISHASSLSKSIPLLRGVHLLDNSTIRSSQSGFPTPKAKAPSATPTPTLKHIKRKRAVDRGIHVSMQKESENGQEELHSPQSILSSPVTDSGLEYHTRLLTKQNHDNKADSQAPSLLSSPSPQIESENPELLSKSRNGPALVQNEPTSTSLSLDQKESPSTAITDSFIQSLHTKLDRLHYELSPGFRSPAPAHWKIIDENVPIWSQGPHKLSMPSRRLKPRSPKGRSPRRSTIRLQTLPPAPTSSKPSLTFWRIRLNRLRSRARVDQLRALAPATTTTLPAETGIDTAAYILRQPPDGIGTDLAAATSLYLGAFGRARTLAHWQRGSDELTSRKRAPSQAALSAPPSKTLRRGAPMAKVRLKRDADVWCPEGFVRPADTTAGAADADAADADAADAAGQLDGGVEDGEVASGSGSGSRTADMEGSNEERAG